MLDQVLRAFDITPEYDLNIMLGRQALSDVICNVLRGLESVLDDAKPDILLVHGDTATTFAGALAAFHKQIPVGHIEAGLRTWDKLAPYPEEIYRQMTDDISEYYFAPTELGRENLLRENHPSDRIYVTGNTAIDALKYTVQADYTHPALEHVGNNRLLLLTAHRRENLGDPMKNVFKAVNRVLKEFPDLRVIYPVHMNPVVREVANEVFGKSERVQLIEPLDVIDFHNFMKYAYLILTDSGGIQEEGPSLGKPVLVCRDVTERPEGVAAGTLKLVGTDEQRVYSSISELLSNVTLYEKMVSASNPYGDGLASKRIADVLLA
jgi:UDP-N-acetylglucosamine 2-epimerase (non-hydrolysing)